MKHTHTPQARPFSTRRKTPNATQICAGGRRSNEIPPRSAMILRACSGHVPKRPRLRSLGLACATPREARRQHIVLRTKGVGGLGRGSENTTIAICCSGHPSVAQISAKIVAHSTMWFDFGQLRLDFANVRHGPQCVKIASDSATGQHRSTPGQIAPRWGRNRPKSHPVCPKPGQIWPAGARTSPKYSVIPRGRMGSRRHWRHSKERAGQGLPRIRLPTCAHPPNSAGSVPLCVWHGSIFVGRVRPNLNLSPT